MWGISKGVKREWVSRKLQEGTVMVLLVLPYPQSPQGSHVVCLVMPIDKRPGVHGASAKPP